MRLIQEFRPALVFLGKFLAFYFAGNILYGLYIESYGDKADPVTTLVTAQTSGVLNIIGYDVSFEEVPGMPKVAMNKSGSVVLYVFEGCNGINVMIVFIAFLFAFGGRWKRFAFFVPAGLLVIHLVNLLRVGLLFSLADNSSTQFYYYHKYFFTATLYVVVFLLWFLWVVKFNETRSVSATA